MLLNYWAIVFIAQASVLVFAYNKHQLFWEKNIFKFFSRKNHLKGRSIEAKDIANTIKQASLLPVAPTGHTIVKLSTDVNNSVPYSLLITFARVLYSRAGLGVYHESGVPF